MRPWSTSTKGQPDHRRGQMFQDEHGRDWHGNIELKTGKTTGHLSPVWAGGRTFAGQPYTVPEFLVPPQGLVRVHPEKPWAVVIDYAAWIADLKQAWLDYRRRVRELEVKFHGDKANEANPSNQTRNLAGPPPMAVDLVLAMQTGNRWALGLTPKMPRWAQVLVPKDETVTMDFPDADEETYLDVEDENLDRVFEAAAPTEGVPEAERVASLEQALAEEREKRQKAEKALEGKKDKKVTVRPRARGAQKPVEAGKE